MPHEIHNHTSSLQCNSQIWFPFSVWLLKDPRLYFPLNQNIPESTRGQEGKSLENVCLWEIDIATLTKNNFKLEEKFDGVCQVELKVSNIGLSTSLFVIYYNIESNARNRISNPLYRIQQMRIAPSKESGKSKKFKGIWNPLSGERQPSQNAEEDCL